jgi:hypothetical protein
MHESLGARRLTAVLALAREHERVHLCRARLRVRLHAQCHPRGPACEIISARVALRAPPHLRRLDRASSRAARPSSRAWARRAASSARPTRLPSAASARVARASAALAADAASAPAASARASRSPRAALRRAASAAEAAAARTASSKWRLTATLVAST